MTRVDTQKRTARFLLTQAGAGFALGALVAATLIATDTGGLLSLVTSTAGALPAAIAFVTEFGGLFAALVTGAAIGSE